MHLSVLYELTRHQHMGPWPWGLRWIDVPFGILMCLPWKLCGHGVDVPFGDLMGLRAPARTAGKPRFFCIFSYSRLFSS